MWSFTSFLVKMHHSSAKREKIPNLVTLHKVKWEENGTITNNRSKTPHEGSFKAGLCSIQIWVFPLLEPTS